MFRWVTTHPRLTRCLAATGAATVLALGVSIATADNALAGGSGVCASTAISNIWGDGAVSDPCSYHVPHGWSDTYRWTSLHWSLVRVWAPNGAHLTICFRPLVGNEYVTYPVGYPDSYTYFAARVCGVWAFDHNGYSTPINYLNISLREHDDGKYWTNTFKCGSGTGRSCAFSYGNLNYVQGDQWHIGGSMFHHSSGERWHTASVTYASATFDGQYVNTNRVPSGALSTGWWRAYDNN